MVVGNGLVFLRFLSGFSQVSTQIVIKCHQWLKGGRIFQLEGHLN